MRPLVAVLLVLGAACSTSPEAPEVAGVNRAVFRSEAGSTELTVEVADSPEERAQGLMGREHLAADRGMVFLFDGPTDSSFWMKDTRIPLSIAFWDEDGSIVDVLEMEPCAEDPCPTYAPAAPYVGAVEANQGFFADHGIGVGDLVELKEATG